MSHPFFKNHGPFKINDLLKDLHLNDLDIVDNNAIHDIRDLQTADENHLTFFIQKNTIYKHLKLKPDIA